MNTLIVGDIHGDVRIVEKVLDFWEEEILFLGDLLDSFTYSRVDQMRCVDLVLDAVENGNGRVNLLLGNHEASYINPAYWKCSGFNKSTSFLLLQNRRIERLRRLCLPYFWVRRGEDPVLASHAGFSDLLVDANLRKSAIHFEYCLTEEMLEKVRGGEYVPFDVAMRRASLDPGSWFYHIGPSRGGWGTAGGPLWCDADEFFPILGITQVFGHTPQMSGKPRWFGKSVCLDVLQSGTAFGVVGDSGGVEITVP